MKTIIASLALIMSVNGLAALPVRYNELLPYVQPAPDQGETNTCLFMASTGAMELLLNKRDKIKKPKVNGPNDLSESFLIWQSDFKSKLKLDIQLAVLRFNHGEAVQNKYWPFVAKNKDGTDNMGVWEIHPHFEELPRIKVPPVETELLFWRGKKWDTNVLYPEDVNTVKQALVENKSPIIINYNDDNYWHVVLIVGYDDKIKGECYELEKADCKPRGAFYVRDSDGKRFEARSYDWFINKANAAAVVRFK